MHEVFISYSKFDKQIADAICHMLESKGIRCWIAPRDEQGGCDYANLIVQAIKNGRILVLIASKHSNESAHVMREINIAVQNNVIIIPFKIDESDLGEGYHYYINKIHWIDAFPDPEHHFSRLIRDISTFLDKNITDNDIDDIKYIKEKNKQKLITNTREERLSLGLSLTTQEEDWIDKSHKYLKLKRVDILEDASYSSYRWLTLRNESNIPTSFIVHKECGENKVMFEAMKVRAYKDNFKGNKLVVKCGTKIQPNFEQVFKIFFEKPLMPGEEINIFYRFNWPGEPLSYYTERQSQSISLTRYERGVVELIYGIINKDKMIDISLKEIDSLFNEKSSEVLPRYLLIREDEDLFPLHEKEYRGVYYEISEPSGVGYRIYYRSQRNDEDPDDDVF